MDNPRFEIVKAVSEFRIFLGECRIVDFGSSKALQQFFPFYKFVSAFDLRLTLNSLWGICCVFEHAPKPYFNSFFEPHLSFEYSRIWVFEPHFTAQFELHWVWTILSSLFANKWHFLASWNFVLCLPCCASPNSLLCLTHFLVMLCLSFLVRYASHNAGTKLQI